MAYLAEGLRDIIDATGTADVSSYVYDALGQLTRMGDGYNLWTWGYDPAGRQVSSEDPDTGTSSTAYDASGRVASRTDELSTVTKYSYDVLDRITKQTVTAAGGTEKTLITNTYDGAGNPLGVLASSTRNNGAGFDQPVTTTFSGFDLAYTPGTTVTTLPAGLTGFGSTSYTFTNTTTLTGKTNVSGTPAIAGLPAESVTNVYNTYDNPYEVRSGSNYIVGGATYNRLNQIASYSQYDSNFTSGANTTGTNKITYNWDAATGRLIDTVATNKLVGFLTDTDLGTTRYTYDPVGRITEREQAYTSRPSSPADSQCYSYDHADRIKAVWTPASTTCGTAPTSTATTVSGLGGPAPYAQTYTYTAAGDRSQVKRFASNGTLSVTEDYTYPTPGTAGAHRPQTVVSTPAGGTATTRSLTWDAAGRLTSRAGQTLTYTLDGRLDTTTGISTIPSNPNPNATAGTPPTAGTSIADDMGARYYDAAGNLVGITDGTGTTVTLGSITAHHNKATGAKTATKTYTFAGKVVGQRTTAGAGTTKLAFIIGDSVNTAQTMTLPNTTASTTNITTLVRRTDPLGLARGSNGTASGNASFTAAANTTAGTGSNAANATGFGAVNGYIAGLNDTASSLTHLGARELDPVIGIFTSPDPILSTEDHRGFTPYTYAFGNVINTSDPTGLRPTCDCEADGSSGTVPGSAQQLQNDYVRNTAPPQLHLTSSKNLGAPGNGMPSRNSYLRYTEPDRCTVGSYSSCSQSQYFLKAARNYHEFENTDWAAALMGFLDFVMIAVTFAEVTGTLGFGTPVVAAQDAAYIGWRSSKLGPSNAANGPRLAQQLAREQAASRANALFTRSGNLTTEAVRDAKIIIPGEELGLRDPNQTLIKYLTRDGSDIKDWGKYSTKSMTESPYGDFKVHFYKNEATGAVDYGYDYKAVFRSR